MYLIKYALAALGLLAATVSDIASNRIPNKITVPIAALGLILAMMEGTDGIIEAIKGLGFGLGAGMLFWIIGAISAGDAKLYAALGCVFGWRWLLDAMCWSILAGSIAGIVLLIHRRLLIDRMKRLWTYFKSVLFYGYREKYEAGGESRVPFAIFISAGSILAAFFPLF